MSHEKVSVADDRLMNKKKDILRGLGAGMAAHVGYFLFLYNISSLILSHVLPNGGYSESGLPTGFDLLGMAMIFGWWLIQFVYLVPLYFLLKRRG